MVALQVRRFDKTYEFKINLLQERSVFECRCRLAVRAGHDRTGAALYNGRPARGSRPPGPYSTVRAQQRTVRRGAEHACLRTTTVVLHRTRRTVLEGPGHL